MKQILISVATLVVGVALGFQVAHTRQYVNNERLVMSMTEHQRNSCDAVREDLALGEAVSRHCHFEYVYRAHELRALVNGD